MRNAILVTSLLALTGCWTLPGYVPPTPSTTPAFIGLKVDVSSLYSGTGLCKENQGGVDIVVVRIDAFAATVKSTEKKKQLEAIATMLARHANEFQADTARGKPWSDFLAKEKAKNIAEMFIYVERMDAQF